VLLHKHLTLQKPYNSPLFILHPGKLFPIRIDIGGTKALFMATVVSVVASPSVSSSSGSSSSYSAAPAASSPSAVVQNTSVRVRQSGAPGDVVSVSRASTLLSAVEQQLKRTPATAINQVLSSAATDIFAQAQAENDPNQAKVLENLATRLQVAASSGSAGLPPYSLAALLG